jgi:hypothetical protein
MTINKDTAATIVGWVLGASFWATVDPAKLLTGDRIEIMKLLTGVLMAVLGHITNHETKMIPGGLGVLGFSELKRNPDEIAEALKSAIEAGHPVVGAIRNAAAQSDQPAK